MLRSEREHLQGGTTPLLGLQEKREEVGLTEPGSFGRGSVK